MNKFATRIILLVVLLAVLIGGGIFYFKQHAQQKALPKPIAINASGQPTIGKANAKIQIIAFEDLKCFNCMRFNTSILPEIKKNFVDTGKVKYTVIPLAFIPGSIPAANAAYCIHAQNPKLFFPFVEYIYHHQPPETQDWATIPTLLQYAEKIKGVNTKTLTTCMVQSPYTNRINKNLSMAMKLMGGTVATPSIYINGHPVQPLTYKRMRQMILLLEKQQH